MDKYFYILENDKPKKVDDIRVWGKWMETADRTVKKTRIGDVSISTVFLGLNHNFIGSNDKPILYETMVFGGKLNEEMNRYATKEEAEKGHEGMIKRVKEEK